VAKELPVKAVTSMKYQYSKRAVLSAFSMLLDVPS
jgi:hypothetical protein